jgi:hypothetical protein
MIRRAGLPAVRDTGSTTGVATAVLAVLSAGTLATLGMVTAGEIRDVGPSRPDSRPADTLRQPGAVRVTEAPTPSETGGTSVGGGGGGNGSGGGGAPGTPGVLPLGPVLVPDLGTTGGSRTLSTSGPGTPTDPAQVPVPLPTAPVTFPTPAPAPTAPVFAGTPEPVPAPEASVLDVKHGRALGQGKDKAAKVKDAKKAKKAKKGEDAAGAASPVTAGATAGAATSPPANPGRGQGRGNAKDDKNKGRPPVVQPSAAPLTAGPVPVAAPESDDKHGRGHDEHGNGNGNGHDKH